MKINRNDAYVICGILVLLLAGCSPTCHTVMKAEQGKISGSDAMESLLDQPGPVELQTLKSAEWSVPLAGLLNLDSPAAINAELKDHEEPIQIYVHVLKHPMRGNYLIDTGMSKTLLDDPGRAGLNWLLRQVMDIGAIQLKTSTAEVLRSLDGPLSGVFLTHLHIDHISGMVDIPGDAALYTGANEATDTYWQNIFSQSAVNQLLMDKQPLQEWPSAPDPQNRFEGITDIFADGSVFAIRVPGHTGGSTAFLIRTTRGPVLLTGDACHTRWGWEHTVEPGTFSEDPERSRKNLINLKNLVARHPQIEVRFGHQP